VNDHCVRAPAAERNKQPILEVLRRWLPAQGTVLEIASGTGQHVAHFAKAAPALVWQPTEMDAERHQSILAWIAAERLVNVRPPIALDVSRHPWPVDRADVVVCINMIHISPWQATLDLMAGSARVLGQGGILFLYGPYRRFGVHTAPSNADFDADLRRRDPAWGVRDLEAVTDCARTNRFAFGEAVPMPANNFSVIFRKEYAATKAT
jgi:SAM-dependent methyltransferase